jgi:hypothetical protein
MSDYSSTCCDKDYQVFEKDPDATLDYRFNWSAWLSGDEIATSSFLLPDGLTEVSSSNTALTATILVAGGTSCQRYRVTNRITTVAGRVTDRTVVIAVKEH